jgi:hypothetical protein
VAAHVAELPVAVASFGGAVQEHWLYVLGGHIGRKHEHSTDNLSQDFVRRRIDVESDWEVLPACTPLQSVSLVSHAGLLYRAGGMKALNASGQPEDLHSVSEVAAFDPRSQRWSDLPPLPEPRSSHDAVVLENRLYVLGGWSLGGDTLDARWMDTAYALDLADPQSWQPLPKAPFQRRAVAAAGLGRAIYVLGGIDNLGKTSRRVDVLDLESDQWLKGPELPFDGFGVSAFTVGERLFVSGMDGAVYRLDGGRQSWLPVARLSDGRIFHRLLPAGGGRLLFVGGANKSGHLTSIEVLDTATLQDDTVASQADLDS